MKDLRVWCNLDLAADAIAQLRQGLHDCTQTGDLSTAHVAFGQPEIAAIRASPHLQWVHLSSAGYTPYDRPEVREAFAERKLALTKSSWVYAAPCADHVVALMLAWARCLPDAWADQAGPRVWPQLPLRRRSSLLRGNRVVLFGLGAIGSHIVTLLLPWHVEIVAVRRRVRGNEPVRAIAIDDPAVDQALAQADHVINTLPASPSTEAWFNAERLTKIRSGAVFYNIGRGVTVEQAALIEQLEHGRLAAAFLDVTTPEPLPRDHPLWNAPHCFITPHTAGGHADEERRLVEHFIANLDRWRRGEPLVDLAFEPQPQS